MTGKAFFLVGPTASGKSGVAQYIAEQDPRYEILSADSMCVYKGMDIGTAKPSAEERSRVVYHGLDLRTPDRPFSVWSYHRYACRVLSAATDRDRRILVVGGSGLYIKCLTAGLDGAPAPDDDRRERWTSLVADAGLEALQEELRRRDPAAYERLADRQNVRRLVRALEAVEAGHVRRKSWRAEPRSGPPAGLAYAVDELRRRIACRVTAMYDNGLMEEVRQLKERYPAWSTTASQAIGYREALRCLAGECSRKEAIAETVRRTRRFARRQRTWFRHQARVSWIAVEPGMDVPEVAERVLAQWDRSGPTPVP